MAIRVQCHANVSKQATLLDGLDVIPLKWRVCGCDLNRSVHEGMNHISHVKVHLKTRSGNVNIIHMVSWGKIPTKKLHLASLVIYRVKHVSIFYIKYTRQE